MSVNVKKYVQGCDACQRNKPHHTAPYGLLQPNNVPAGPWEIVTCDLIIELPESTDADGNTWTAILVIADWLTKRAHFFRTTDNVTSTEVANIFYKHIFKLHGLPQQIISDRGTQFAAKVFQEFCQKLGIRSSMSTAYHPETDSQTERINQVLEQYIRMFCNHCHSDWERFLSTAEFSYNNASHESTKLSPFFVETGWNPRMAPDAIGELENPSLEDLFFERTEAQEQAQAALTLAAEHAKWYYDQHKSDVPFKVGDQVMLKGKEVKVKGSDHKFAAKNYGPYSITHQFGPVTFKLKLPPASQAHPVFHASKLILYHKDAIGDCNPNRPEPVLVNGYQEYKVERILDSKLYRRRVKYLVKWLGYDDSENTWEPPHHLKGFEDELRDFHRENPDAPEPISLDDSRPIAILFKRHERFVGAQP